MPAHRTIIQTRCRGQHKTDDKCPPKRISLNCSLNSGRTFDNMSTLRLGHHQLLFLASLFFVAYSEAFAATTFTPFDSIQRKVTTIVHRGGSLSATTNTSLDDGDYVRSNPSKKSKISLAKGFGTTLLTSNNGSIGRNGKDGLNGSNDSNSANRRNNDKVSGVVEPPEKERTLPCRYVAETKLPTDLGDFRLRAYRVDDFHHETYVKNEFVGKEPCVIYFSEKPPFGSTKDKRVDVPIRVHDQCLTSEVFGSKRCDCKEQFQKTLMFVKENGGAIIYLQQEGRGIGIANKVAAYALQDEGLDTVDANTHLGFPEDARQYGVIPSILEDMCIDSIKLITNNPRKVDRLVSLGVDVKGTIPMVVKANKHNINYIKAKKERMSHKNFGEMLSLDKQQNDNDLSNLVSDAMITLRYKNNDTGANDFINNGEEMAANAIQSALNDEELMAGVRASDDGYCFGRKSVEDAIAAVARGEIVVVVDDMDRENEGDFIMAADMATPETIATIIRYSSGVICVGMEGSRMDELNLPAMLKTNEDPKETAFSVTVDATKEHGITTGISAIDRAKTMRLLADPSRTAKDFARPGHIFPLRAKEGGVLTRDGHTEAAVDLSRLAGRNPSGVLCEIVSEENPVEMARLPELIRFCEKHGFVLTSIVDIAQYRRDTENLDQ